MTTKVRILLDVDGVLNAVPGHTKDWADWERGPAMGFHINWSQTVAKFIRHKAETPGVEVVWLTTWEDDANYHICPLLNLPECVVAFRQPDELSGWWKFDCAKKLWDETQVPFVWIDDDLKYEDAASRWAFDLDDKALTICPQARRGLVLAQLDRIDEFVERWNGT